MFYCNLIIKAWQGSIVTILFFTDSEVTLFINTFNEPAFFGISNFNSDVEKLRSTKTFIVQCSCVSINLFIVFIK